MEEASEILRPFVGQRTVRLTTFRRDGSAVGTAVTIAVDGPRAFIRTYASAGKARRICNNPIVEVAPSTFLGEATGPAIRARARLLAGEESRLASRLITRKHPWLQGLAVPLTHRLSGKKTIHFELTPLAESIG